MPLQIHKSENKHLSVSGFEPRTITIFFRERLSNVELMLPISPATDELVRQRTEAGAESARVFDEQADARRAAAEESRRALAYVSAQGKKDAESALSPPGPTRSNAKKSSRFDVQVERFSLQKRYENDLEDLVDKHDHVQIYDCAEPLKLLIDAEVRTPDKEWRERDEALYEQLAKKGSFDSAPAQPAGAADREESQGHLRGSRIRREPYFLGGHGQRLVLGSRPDQVPVPFVQHRNADR